MATRYHRTLMTDVDTSCEYIAIGSYYGSTYNVQVRLPLALAQVGPAALLIGLRFIRGTSDTNALVGAHISELTYNRIAEISGSKRSPVEGARRAFEDLQ
jgi:hypothetical protein